MLNQEKLSLIVNLGVDLSQAKDLDLLLERILSDARRFFNADAGSFYMKKGDRLEFAHTQNDTLQKKLAPGKKLVYSSFSVPLTHETIAGFVADTGELLNLPDVYRLPESAPFTFGRAFDEVSGYRTRSVLAVPLRTYRGDTIGVLQLINAKDPEGRVVAFDREEEPYLLHFANSAATAIERANITRSMILRTIEMARLRDPRETGPHVKRVASYSVVVYETWARWKGVPRAEIEHHRDILKISSMLHDVGKVAISDNILKKPARLDKDEFEIMKQHTWMGANLFADKLSEYDASAAAIALSHHEKWDGTGYPGHISLADGKPLPGFETPGGGAVGKKGDEIPVFGRIVAVADVYDALSSARSYKGAWTEDRVLETIRGDAGTHFDREAVEAFLFDLDVIRNIRERNPDE